MAEQQAAGAAGTSSVRAWSVVLILLVLYLFGQVDRYVIGLLVQPISSHFGVGDFKMGLLMGPAFGLLYIAAAIPLGWAADRTSRRGVMFAGVMLWAVAACFCGLARTYNELFIARMAVGIGEAALLPAAYSIVSQLFPRDRLAVALSVLSLGSVGGMGTALLVGALIARLGAGSLAHLPLIGDLESWQLVFLITGAPVLLLGFLVFAIPDDRGAQAAGAATAEPPLRVFPFLRQNARLMIGTFGGFSLMALVTAAIASWAPTYMIRSFGWSITQTGFVLGLMTLLFSSVGKIGSGILVDWLFRIGRADAHVRFYAAVIAITGPTALIAFLLPTAVPFVILLAVYYMLAVPFMGFASAFIQLVTPVALRGRISALFLFAVNASAMTVGPTLVGWMTEDVFGDKGALGWSIAAVVLVFAPPALLLLLQALGPARTLLGGDQAPEKTGARLSLKALKAS